MLQTESTTVWARGDFPMALKSEIEREKETHFQALTETITCYYSAMEAERQTDRHTQPFNNVYYWNLLQNN